MKQQYVRDLADGSSVDSAFGIRSRDLRSARTGDTYLALELGDRTGIIRAVKFRPSPSDESVPSGAVARVRGRVTSYRGVRSVSIDTLRPTTDYDRADMIPAGVRDRDELLEEFKELARSVAHPGLKALLRTVFGDPGIASAFPTCPGSICGHHAYVGGLLEHTVGVATLCLGLADAYPFADRDLLVTAALLHDIGRIEELVFDTSVGPTERGRLIGHVVLGERLVSGALIRSDPPVDLDLATRLSHALLSHHGAPGPGSPVQPCTLDALLLHHADSLDAVAGEYSVAVAGAALLDETWTDAANTFGRALRVPVRSSARI